MRARSVALDCGASRSVVGAFDLTPDGDLVLLDCAISPSVEQGAGGERLPPPAWAKMGSVVVAPAAHRTLLKTVALPTAGGAKREQVLGFEAGQIAGGGLADAVWSHEPVSLGVAEREALAVMKLEVGESVCAEIGRWGLTVDRIVPAAWALVRALRHNYPEVVGPAVVVWIDGRAALLVRVERADIAVRLVGLPGAAPAPNRTQGVVTGVEPMAEQRERGHTPWLDRVTVELARLASGGESQGAAQLEVFLGGDDAAGPEAVAMLAARAAVRVSGFDALRRVRISARASGADRLALQMGVVVGLALEAGNRAGIDLLPPARRSEGRFRRARVWRLALAASVVVAMMVSLLLLRRERLALERESAVVAAWLAPQRVAEQRQRDGERERALLHQQMDALAAIRAARVGWLDWLVDLQERLTKAEDVWLESLEVSPSPAASAGSGGGLLGPGRAAGTVEAASEGRRIVVTGRVLRRAGADPLERVRRLREGLMASRFVAAVENERFDDTQPGQLRFSCTLVMKPEATL